MSTILQNALYFPAHEVYLPSTHVHDYREFEYLPGFTAMVDGGKEYIHRSVTPPEHAHLVIPWDLSSDNPWELVTERLLWGSLPRDKTLPQVHTHRPIRILAKDHLEAILANVPNIGPVHRQVVKYWLDTL